MRNGHFVWTLVLVCCSCSPQQRTPSASGVQAENKGREANAPSGSSDPAISGHIKGIPKAEEAWRSFEESERYGTARPEDFRIPEWAMQAYGSDLKKAMSHPIIAGGDMNRDGAAYDFAVIVVDKNRDEATRFGVVVFNAPTKPKESYTIHWLLRERDLSKFALARASTRSFLTEYREDGSLDTCEIVWDKLQRKYVCNRK